ncbi:hypothetical protein QQS21_005676 [Conoideocrella luteorostrata]|uniref:nitric-oxide synthase (NADPH) n=1 Tax=Conoideocrella luteorostrata TaxID=1105319 RepID=A0AAJ0CP13_9HYPO|nr:hypothetical protein QQS21_005676 [Conoideocrella luteorostrata]
MVPNGRLPPCKEFERIQQHYANLSSTGCNKTFCQSGRMIHTDEQRVGEDRDLREVIFEAIDFISQLSRDGLIKDNEAMRQRVDQALEEIHQTSVKISVEDSKLPRVVGGNWTQTIEELEHGMRLSWKHARKCIMRSEYSSLRLYDLRHVKSSAEMGRVLLDKLTEAFNGGDIHPSVFVFPAREPNKPGPMIWNTQLLAFAGYTQPDGSVLGDPGNVSITESIISLGWQPPAIRTRWDLLPLVTMADGDEPYITQIPPNSFPLVSIRHPNYPLGFDKLGLRWVPAPALSRLGFDIGGVQYTATPFIGWFMDAEIGVRNLADSFRYDSLPAVSSALQLLEPGQSFDDLPQEERLLVLSRSQAELNYAVHWSFQQAGVRMSDSLSASSMYTDFDDNHLATYGFRLPADPYWLSPPQGSIIPVWHRGGAPNYQPKPMICRLKANPVTIWKRKHGSNGVAVKKKYQSATVAMTNGVHSSQSRSLRIFYCSSGSTAQRLAKRLAETLTPKLRPHINGEKPTRLDFKALSSLDWDAFEPGTIILVIASSTGRGDIPPNGLSMLRNCETRDPGQLKDISFAIFGNGNASYGSDFNGAAIKLQDAMVRAECKPVLPLLKGDTSKENPPWRQFDAWVKQLMEILDGNISTADTSEQSFQSNALTTRDLTTKDLATKDHEIISLTSQFAVAELVSTESFGSDYMQRVVLNVGKLNYTPMWHADVIVPLWGHEIDELLDAFGLTGKETCELNNQKWTFRQLFSLVDTEKPFKSLSWTKLICPDVSAEKLSEMKDYSVKEVVNKLRLTEYLKPGKPSLLSLALDLPTRSPRTFSIASSQHYQVLNGYPSHLELLVETHTGGLFTDKFLSSAESGQELYVRLRAGPGECLLGTTSPLIAFTIGSGIAPLRGLLQHKSVTKSREIRIVGESSLISQQFAMFAGFKAEDSEVIKDCVQEAACAGRLGFLALTPSNVLKERVQDTLFKKNCSKFIRKAILEQGACIFACASRTAVDDFARNLEAIIGVDSIRDILKDRWIEEIFEPTS